MRSFLFVSSSLLSRLTFRLNFIGQFFWSYHPRSNQLLFSADILSIVSGISKILSNKSTPCPFETRLSFPTYVSCLSQCGWNKGVKRRPLCQSLIIPFEKRFSLVPSKWEGGSSPSYHLYSCEWVKNSKHTSRSTKKPIQNKLCHHSAHIETTVTLGSIYFFLIDTDRSRGSFTAKPLQRRMKRREKARIFHIRYFENGPLEPG